MENENLRNDWAVWHLMKESHLIPDFGDYYE